MGVWGVMVWIHWFICLNLIRAVRSHLSGERQWRHKEHEHIQSAFPHLLFQAHRICSCWKEFGGPRTLAGCIDRCMQTKKATTESRLFLSRIMKRKKNLTRKRGEHDCVSWRCFWWAHTDCCGKQHSSEAFKAWRERHRQKERRENERDREREGATWENKQSEIMGLAVMRHSAAATLAVFI